MTALRWIDIPPVWLALALAAAWRLGQWRPFGLSFGGDWIGLPGGLLVGAGLVLMALAVAEMRRQDTTVIPHMEAEHLVQTGIFKRLRRKFRQDFFRYTQKTRRWL